MKFKIVKKFKEDLSSMHGLLKSFLPFARKRMGFNKPPKIYFQSDDANAKKLLGKTAHYDPTSMCVTVYVTGRHPKDVLRSLSHPQSEKSLSIPLLRLVEQWGLLISPSSTNATHPRQNPRNAHLPLVPPKRDTTFTFVPLLVSSHPLYLRLPSRKDTAGSGSKCGRGMQRKDFLIVAGKIGAAAAAPGM